MVKFIATTDSGKILLGIGLEKGNVVRLQNNEPIHFFLSSLTEDKIDEVVIFYGNTRKEMYDRMKEIGLIDEKTKIQESPKTKVH